MTTLLVLASLFGGLIGAIVMNLIASDLFEWGRRWAEMLVRYAATRWPPALRERVLEEWLAELDHMPGMIWRVRFAVSIVVSRPPRSLTPRVLPPMPVFSRLSWALGIFTSALTIGGLILFTAGVELGAGWIRGMIASLALSEIVLLCRRDVRAGVPDVLRWWVVFLSDPRGRKQQ